MTSPMSEEELAEALDAATRLAAWNAANSDKMPPIGMALADAYMVARALLSTSASERGLRKALALVDKGFRTKKLKDASIIVGDDVKALSEIVRAALSPKGEDTQARSPSAHSAPTHTDTKNTTNA